MSLAARLALFASCCAGAAALHWQTLPVLWQRSDSDTTASHIVLVPLVAAGLLFMRRDVVFASVRTWWRGGLPLVAAGLAGVVSMFGRPLQPDQGLMLTLAALPLIVLWIGVFALIFGPSATRAATFPLAFLCFMAPFPALLLEPVNDFLKWGSAEVVEALFALTQTPYVREGYTFRLPFVAIEVADECSGIRSTIGLLLTTMIAAHLYLETSWKRALLLLVIVPITLLKNGIRIAVLCLLAIHVDPSYLQGQLHHEGGILFFVISWSLIAPLLIYLARSERGGGPRLPGDARAATA
jgi:exosortase